MVELRQEVAPQAPLDLEEVKHMLADPGAFVIAGDGEDDALIIEDSAPEVTDRFGTTIHLRQ